MATTTSKKQIAKAKSHAEASGAKVAVADNTHRNTKVGEVVSTKMQKTIVVAVEMRKAHTKYKRIIRSTKKFYAHDEQNTAHVGDVVRIRETRPLSKLKRWQLEEVVRRSALAQMHDIVTEPETAEQTA
jgi:small subunit ribosomal protein S17